jgi:hypothetical protein
MSSDSSHHKVKQKTEERLASTMAKVANRQALPKGNVLRANIVRAPLDFIVEIIQANH